MTYFSLPAVALAKEGLDLQIITRFLTRQLIRIFLWRLPHLADESCEVNVKRYL